MKVFNYLEAPCNRKTNVCLSYETMLYLQTICNFVDRMVIESNDYFNYNVEEIMSGQVEEYDPAKSEYIERIIDDVVYLCEFHDNDVTTLMVYNEEIYDMLWNIHDYICTAEKDYKLIFDNLVQLRKELAKTEF